MRSNMNIRQGAGEACEGPRKAFQGVLVADPFDIGDRVSITYTTHALAFAIGMGTDRCDRDRARQASPPFGFAVRPRKCGWWSSPRHTGLPLLRDVCMYF